MGLFNEIVLKKWQKIYNSFYDDKQEGIKYSKLNEIDSLVYSPQKLYDYQRKIFLQEINKNSFLKQGNDFINSLSLYNSDQTEKESANQIIEKVADILNSPFKSGKKDIRDLKASRKVKQFKEALEKITPGIEIPNTILNQLESNDIIRDKEIFSKYRQEKADFFEEIAAAFLRGQGLKASAMGAVGNISKNNQQLPTDIYAFIQDTTFKKSGSYGSSIKSTSGDYIENVNKAIKNYNSGNFLSVSIGSDIKEFLNEIEKLKGDASLNISIDDEMEQAMTQVATLKVQVKSGMGQSILNPNKINAIALSSFSYKDKLELLMQLYNDVNPNRSYLLRSVNSVTLAGYTNTLLTQNLSKTTILNNGTNNVYFTEKGFETAYDWMTRTKRYLKFSQDVKLTAQLLSIERKYNFFSV